MPRERKKRIINHLPEKGVFGKCGKCGGRVVYYDDCGVRCEKCGELKAISAYKKVGGKFV